jgi:hypothetical protein
MRTSLHTAALWLGLSMVSFGVHAEGGFCPPGTIDHNNGRAPAIVCSPIPGYGQQQAPRRPAEVWQDRYGAIAIDGPNKATGSAVNMRSEGAAREAAIADCGANGGANCVVELPFRNGCAAVATGDTGHNASAHQTIAEASSAALKVCVASGDTNCVIYYKVCSPPVRVQ